jgi:hypothetical protein
MRDEFVKRHSSTLLARDSLSVRSVTLKGFVDLYLLFFIHVGMRRLIVSGYALTRMQRGLPDRCLARTQRLRRGSVQSVGPMHGPRRFHGGWTTRPRSRADRG